MSCVVVFGNRGLGGIGTISIDPACALVARPIAKTHTIGHPTTRRLQIVFMSLSPMRVLLHHTFPAPHCSPGAIGDAWRTRRGRLVPSMPARRSPALAPEGSSGR